MTKEIDSMTYQCYSCGNTYTGNASFLEHLRKEHYLVLHSDEDLTKFTFKGYKNLNQLYLQPSLDKEAAKDAEIKEDDRVTSSCGATSSKVPLRYDLIPITFLQRVAKRYTEGAEKHGEYNYRKGLTDEKYIQERINHLLNHLYSWLLSGNTQDDNLAAIAWGVAFLMEAEQIPAGFVSVHNALRTMNYTTNTPLGGISKKGI